jgi:hypothetical protein
MKRTEPIPRSDNIKVEFTAVQPPPKRLTEKRFPGAYFPPTRKKARPHRKCVVCARKGQRKETQYWGSVVFTRMLQGVSYTPRFLNHLLPLLSYRALIL